jgi:hypothetical protein
MLVGAGSMLEHVSDMRDYVSRVFGYVIGNDTLNFEPMSNDDELVIRDVA